MRPFLGSIKIEHKDELRKICPQNVDRRHKDQFVAWVEHKINKLYEQGKISDQIYALSLGSDHRVRVFNICFINGYLFRTAHIEKNLGTQNSGVVVKGDGSTSNMEWYVVTKKLSHWIFLMKRKWSFFSVTGMMYLLPTRTKAEDTIRISMGLSILIHPDFDISMILTLWGHKLSRCFM